MMRIPISGATNIFCDNKTVCDMARKPEAHLNKKHNTINFHQIWEAIAAKWCCVAHEPGSTNLSDFLTKILSTAKCKTFLSQVLR